MMGSMLVHVMYTVVDTAFVGRLDPQALAGMTLVFPVFMVLIAIANGVGSGISVLVSQAIGRQDLPAAERIAGTAVFLGLSIGALLSLCGLLWGQSLLANLGASAEVTRLGWQYLQIQVAISPLMLITTNLRFILTGQGDARTPLVVMLISSAANLILDPIFIFVLDLGIRGAALASAAAQLLGMLCFLVALFVLGRSLIRLRLSYMRSRLMLIVDVLRLGLPSSLAVLTMAVGSMLLNSIVARFGDTALAGYGAAARVDQMVAMPLLGLASAAVAVVGMFAGAARPDLIRQVALYVYRWALTIALALGVVAYLSSHVLMSIFTTDIATIQIGSHYLGYMLFVYPMMAIGIVSGRLLLELGYPGLSLLTAVIRLLLVAAPVAYVSVLLFDAPIDGVWTGVLSGSAASTVASIFLIRLYLWRRDPTVRATRPATDQILESV